MTGDWHSTFVNDLKLDFKEPTATAYTEASWLVRNGNPGALPV